MGSERYKLPWRVDSTRNASTVATVKDAGGEVLAVMNDMQAAGIVATVNAEHAARVIIEGECDRLRALLDEHRRANWEYEGDVCERCGALANVPNKENGQ